MFDGQGRYSLQIVREDRVRFAANDKSKGTPQEYADAVRGSNAHFGRYTVNAADKTITFHIEHASYPNWEGTEQTRSLLARSLRTTSSLSAMKRPPCSLRWRSLRLR